MSTTKKVTPAAKKVTVANPNPHLKRDLVNGKIPIYSPKASTATS
jgi:hypothetical protein